MEWTIAAHLPVKVRRTPPKADGSRGAGKPSERVPIEGNCGLVKPIASGSAIRVSAEDCVAAVAVSEACRKSPGTDSWSPACR
jgi:hypothetical protein